MFEYHSVELIFKDLEIFVIDYVKFFQMLAEHAHGNIFSIRLTDEEFFFPATLTEFSHRAMQLKDRFQRQIRSLAQKRRNEISRGIDLRQQNPTKTDRIRFDVQFKNHLEQLQTHPNIHRIQIIIDALELYDQISPLGTTFRLIPILQHIQKQLCCLASNLEQILDQHRLIIERHLRKLHEKLHAYDEDMRKKFSEYLSRDIRPPVLVIPCPQNSPNVK